MRKLTLDCQTTATASRFDLCRSASSTFDFADGSSHVGPLTSLYYKDRENYVTVRKIVTQVQYFMLIAANAQVRRSGGCFVAGIMCLAIVVRIMFVVDDGGWRGRGARGLTLRARAASIPIGYRLRR